jgi:hypothetical protein
MAAAPSTARNPRALPTGKIGNKTFAFVGLERIGGVMVHVVSTPTVKEDSS